MCGVTPASPQGHLVRELPRPLLRREHVARNGPRVQAKSGLVKVQAQQALCQWDAGGVEIPPTPRRRRLGGRRVRCSYLYQKATLWYTFWNGNKPELYPKQATFRSQIGIGKRTQSRARITNPEKGSPGDPKSGLGFRTRFRARIPNPKLGSDSEPDLWLGFRTPNWARIPRPISGSDSESQTGLGFRAQNRARLPSPDLGAGGDSHFRFGIRAHMQAPHPKPRCGIRLSPLAGGSPRAGSAYDPKVGSARRAQIKARIPSPDLGSPSDPKTGLGFQAQIWGRFPNPELGAASAPKRRVAFRPPKWDRNTIPFLARSWANFAPKLIKF